MSYTATEAAKLADVTRSTIYTWCRMGAVRAHKVAGRWIIEEASLNKRIGHSKPTATTPNRKATMSQTNIKIDVEGNTLYLVAPFREEANTDYKGLGGKWDRTRRSWKFSASDLEPLRGVLREHFGYDDRPVETVTARVALEGDYSRGDGPIVLFNRRLAIRQMRDAPVKLGNGVRVVEGHFAGRGGSMQYPAIGDVDDIVLEVRNVPSTHPDLDDDNVTIQEPEELPGAELADLKSERAQLIARLTEIDAKLAQIDQ